MKQHPQSQTSDTTTKRELTTRCECKESLRQYRRSNDKIMNSLNESLSYAGTAGRDPIRLRVFLAKPVGERPPLLFFSALSHMWHTIRRSCCARTTLNSAPHVWELTSSPPRSLHSALTCTVWAHSVILRETALGNKIQRKADVRIQAREKSARTTKSSGGPTLKPWMKAPHDWSQVRPRSQCPLETTRWRIGFPFSFDYGELRTQLSTTHKRQLRAHMASAIQYCAPSSPPARFSCASATPPCASSKSPRVSFCTVPTNSNFAFIWCFRDVL